MSEFEDEMKKAVEEGYIKANGFPLKCWKCGSKNLKFIDHFDDNILVEQSVKCNDCKKDVGLWSYGNWII